MFKTDHLQKQSVGDGRLHLGSFLFLKIVSKCFKSNFMFIDWVYPNPTNSEQNVFSGGHY